MFAQFSSRSAVSVGAEAVGVQAHGVRVHGVHSVQGAVLEPEMGLYEVLFLVLLCNLLKFSLV